MANFALELVLLTAGYWAVDLLVRREGFLRTLRRLHVRNLNAGLALWVLPCLALAPVWSWEALPQGGAFRLLALLLAGMLAWQAATRDIDPVAGEARLFTRLLLVALTAGIYFSPAFLLAAGLLLTTPFGLWQHHATLPMRLLQALMAHACLAAGLGTAPLFSGAAAVVFFLLTIQVSHYFITGLAKCLLGPKWYSWVLDNRLHHIAASAYSWGWARFLPWTTWRRVIGGVKRVEKPLQLMAFATELLAPLALLHPFAAIGFALGWTAFHLGVFALSGLLFWDWMAANLALAYCISRIAPEALAGAFGPGSVAASLVLMALFPLRHKLWQPMPLGWFDTPLTQRIHWRVRGESGKVYGLYNNFMCPHERLYGKVHGCFLAPVPVMTYHLGEVWKHDLRDAIRAAGPDPEKLEEVRRRFGILPRCEIRAANHRAYLRRFFQELNRGARKRILPRALGWLKAPGDQIFYWGDLPAYRGQEKAAQVSLYFREEYFDGGRLCRLREEKVLDFQVDGDLPAEPVRELTPKEVDDFLLGFAAGRLIDLPGFGGGYVKGEDGRPAAPSRAA